MYSIIDIYSSVITYVVLHLMKDRNLSRKDAIVLWSTSETRNRFVLSSMDFTGISAPRVYEELERELNNDKFWFKFPF